MSKKRSYKSRKIYAEYFDIDIPKGLDIHHIDGNPENDDIKNLLMLPRKLHNRYHTCKNSALAVFQLCDGNLRGYNQYNFLVIDEFSEVTKECWKWMMEKQELAVRKWYREGVPPIESQ